MAKSQLDRKLQQIEQHYPNSPQFLQAVHEVGDDIAHFIHSEEQPALWRAFDVLAEPDRIIQFRVDWERDDGRYACNRGFRIQFNNTLGPYKGGLRFHSDASIDEFMFLGFEQTFKNSLTGLPMGGAKGGADFDPKQHSENEIRRFCQAFITQLAHHIGPDRDIPAGDIGVGVREIGYMFHHYKTLSNQFKGVLTGKHPTFGGSCIREEATGYGAVYFLQDMLQTKDESLQGKTCVLSGAGNVALFTAKKLIDKGAKVLTLSDSQGVYYDADGITAEQIETLIAARAKRQRLAEITGLNGDYSKQEKPWQFGADIVLPCATQNEIDQTAAEQILQNTPQVIVECANMPCTEQALQQFQQADVMVLPSKAVNAGGVAVSGLEISQNRARLSWQASHVDERLQTIMQDIHQQCVRFGKTKTGVDYQRGANIAAFNKLTQALSYSGLIDTTEESSA
ncbi:MAG: NADP-specific glutamate dehydrogenase [Gammaproteobacteria bacterium]|nr:NADP-specific glutamate dehydrogenase [Gammaproteobacteria bacterium]NVK87653.1 NADP-specific glutamate dehydrogenase [Gammaproteobacteria bacterium]